MPTLESPVMKEIDIVDDESITLEDGYVITFSELSNILNNLATIMKKGYLSNKSSRKNDSDIIQSAAGIFQKISYNPV